MEGKDPGACPVEIREIEDKDTPSGRTTRASLAKLPKIGIFSSSSKSVNASEAAIEVPKTTSDGDQPQATLRSKPPSRQGAEKTSRLTTQQLQIHVNLSDILDSKRQVETPKRQGTPKREETPKSEKRQMTPKREEREETTRIASKPTNTDPPIWDRSHGSSSVSRKVKGERNRERTKTWPALQYRLWLDSSNLPLHLLCNDERANRPTPQSLLLPQLQAVARKNGAKSSRPSSSINYNNSFKLRLSTDQHGKSNMDWSEKFLNVSQPPFRPDKKNSDRGTILRSRKAEGDRKGAPESALAAAVNDLQVGVGESWQVATSYAHRPESRSRQRQNHKSIGKLRSIDGVGNNLPQIGNGTTYPRIPSRMGPNDLEAFLKQNTATTLGDVSHSHSGESIPGLRSNNSLSTPSSKLPTDPAVMISPRHFCSTSAEVNLLTLRSYARNPRMLQELTERNKDFNPRHQNHKAIIINKPIESAGRDGVRHVRFKVPCGVPEDELEEMKVALARSTLKNSGGMGMGNRILSDVTPPQTPPNFDQTFRISVLPHHF